MKNVVLKNDPQLQKILLLTELHMQLIISLEIKTTLDLRITLLLTGNITTDGKQTNKLNK